MTDLDKLIEAVEGEADAHVVQIFAKRLSSAAIDRGDYWPSHDVEKAFRGSLDAARALHDALLPGHTRDVDATSPEIGVVVRIWSPQGPINGAGDKQCEARSWLIATLKAYRSLQ